MAERKGIIVVVSGFSGTGKGTLMKRLITQYNNNYTLSVSMTTRKPRAGEVNGREYFFTTDDEFERLVREGKFIEYAGYCGHYYGTPKEFVDRELSEGKDVLLEIEVQGALQVREIYPEAVLLFVAAPSVEELMNRLKRRGTESAEVIKQRLERAKEEAKFIDKYNYLLVNDDLNRCTKQMHQIIQAAHSSPKRNREFIEELVSALNDGGIL